MIRSRDVIFNERVMYKDMHKTDISDTRQSEPVFADVDDVLDNQMIESIIAGQSSV